MYVCIVTGYTRRIVAPAAPRCLNPAGARTHSLRATRLSALNGERRKESWKKEPPRRSASDAAAILSLSVQQVGGPTSPRKQRHRRHRPIIATAATCTRRPINATTESPAHLWLQRGHRRERGARESNREREREGRLVASGEGEREREDESSVRACASWPAQSKSDLFLVPHRFRASGVASCVSGHLQRQVAERARQPFRGRRLARTRRLSTQPAHIKSRPARSLVKVVSGFALPEAVP